MHSDPSASDPLSPDVIARLVANHRQFLGFLEARTKSRVQAEEILQAAFVRAMEKAHTLENEESATAWFFRLLRNSLVDHYRKRARERIAPEAELAELPSDEELHREVCRCIDTLIPTLKPEYAEILKRVELQGARLGDVASEFSISANNAAVRLHRARQALKQKLEQSCGTCATHGCLDCSCSPGHCSS
ncbi:MAG: RNA polymerase sigma factor [Myxococcota bacterium]